MRNANHANQIRHDFSNVSLIQIRRNLVVFHVTQVFQRKAAVLWSIRWVCSYDDPTEKLAMDGDLAQRMVSEPDSLFDRAAQTQEFVRRVRPAALNANLE